MKKNVIIMGLFALTGIVNSQTFNPGGSTPLTSVYRKGLTGFGMTAAPVSHIVEIQTSVSNDGLSITQLNSGDCLIKLNNLGTGGFNWSINATDNTTNPNGAFFISNVTNATRPFIIDPSTDNIGMGTPWPLNAKLDVLNATGDVAGSFSVSSNVTGTFEKIGGQGIVYSAVTNTIFGLKGEASLNNGNGYGYGVFGRATGGAQNIGGEFLGSGSSTSWNIGIYATATGGSSTEYAGYFSGNVLRTGTDNFTSDRKLKQDIEPLANSLEKLLKLKPSSYIYRTSEYKDMNLPKGRQMGLIAQELEEIFPELVTNIQKMELPGKDGAKVSMPEFKAVQYISLIPVLISAIQEQQAQIEELKKNQKTTGIESNNNSLNNFVMGQNEPNPFTGETLIPFTLPEHITKASLIVYDLAGKQIALFPINERGSSSLKLSSEKLSAGIYIYSIIADGKIMDSKKMILADK